MNRRSFIRKVVYLVAIAALLAPMSMLSQPATVATSSAPASPGGKLAQLRDQYQLGQANLGEVDPTSETLKLMTLGLRGFVGAVLWHKADEYKERADWLGLSAVLEQITHLYPNYVGVWIYQSHNLSYNVSAEWDDFRDKYYWVIRGIQFLQKGGSYNENEPRLLTQVGFFAGNKIGHSDDRNLFRKLFREDDDFHKAQPFQQRDNFLYSKQYHLMSQRLVDNKGVSPGMGAVLFHIQPVMSQVNYSAALENDGTFGPGARDAWRTAAAEWRDFSRREFPDRVGGVIRLGDLALLESRLEETRQQLDQLEPGLRQRLIDARRDELPEEQRRALDTPAELRSSEQDRLADTAEQRLGIPDAEVAAQIADPQAREQADELVARIANFRQAIFEVRMNREIVNFDYWLDRVEMEALPETIEARRLIYEARRAYYEEADLLRPRERFEQAFALWRQLVDKYPRMKDDITAQDMLEVIREYEQILKQLDEPFPQDFILADLLELRVNPF